MDIISNSISVEPITFHNQKTNVYTTIPTPHTFFTFLNKYNVIGIYKFYGIEIIRLD